MLSVSTSASPETFHHTWNTSIAMGRAYELLRQDALAHLSAAQAELGFGYCRFHGIFHDDMAVCRRREDGSLAFQWHQVDKIFDSLLAMGLRPFVELNCMPSALASGRATMFEWKMNITPPTNWEEWGQLCREFTRHCVARYGLEEVRQWYFEVWNEPNLSGFWSGTQEDYWKLYEHAVLGVRSVDSRLKVGGPATSKGAWVAELIAVCDERKLPIDFVSTHYYPQDIFNGCTKDTRPDEEGGGFFIRKVREVRDTVRRSTRPDLEIHFTEWNTLYAARPEDVSWTKNPSVDNLSGAALVSRICTALDGAVDSLCYWTASDIFEESGMPHSPFSGTYGLFSIHGHPKPNYHAFAFLKRLTGERLVVSGLPGGEDGPRGAVATRDGEIVRVLLWNQEMIGAAEWRDEVALEWRGASAPVVVASRITDGHGSAYRSWVGLGKPHNLTPATERLLAFETRPEVTREEARADAAGRLALPVRLQPGEVLLLEIEPAEPAVLPKGRARHEVEHWDRLMNAPSK